MAVANFVLHLLHRVCPSQCEGNLEALPISALVGIAVGLGSGIALHVGMRVAKRHLAALERINYEQIMEDFRSLFNLITRRTSSRPRRSFRESEVDDDDV